MPDEPGRAVVAREWEFHNPDGEEEGTATLLLLDPAASTPAGSTQWVVLYLITGQGMALCPVMRGTVIPFFRIERTDVNTVIDFMRAVGYEVLDISLSEAVVTIEGEVNLN